MPPTVVCLPFPELPFPEHYDEDADPDGSRSDLLDRQPQEGEGDPTKAATSAKQRSSEIQPTRPPTRKRGLRDKLATEVEKQSPRETRTPKTTPPSDNKKSGLKRKRNEVFGSDTEDTPPPATKKRRGRKNMQKERDIESPGLTPGQGLEEDGGSDEWEAERIVGARIEADTYIHWYEVKWKNWSTKHNTWEPKKNLAACQNLIEEFEALEQKKATAKKKHDKKQHAASLLEK
ncbi:Chromo domain-like protein [Cordyceps fumosorosea ARSEF 2679]|uniref:Chromo domain-like protein n=1 Tax=Cordyceps fumosorosea (strain ARSEF 2679) TaxID=1081104 RepID=A0A162MHD7_CORFA|nr:Chromo domain-like protein [Cordyceps fumosorosea ARSEF 2679]OAA56080.1 Chromo domain-like protein [Cordyceps fumosorosea ARSEF 2679]